jgi:hypothetical protein
MGKLPEKRTELVEVALTPTEKAEIIAAARSEGMQTSAFMRYCALKAVRS